VIIRHLAAALLLITATAQAAESPSVRASAGWVRLLPGTLPAGGYVTLENTSDQAVTIVGATSPDYADTMIHRSSTDGGMGRMQMVDSVVVPAKGTLQFSPGGYHVMLMQPKHALKPGDKVGVTFVLSDKQTVSAMLVARPANASGPSD
jgi:copper(I)-binding protein